MIWLLVLSVVEVSLIAFLQGKVLEAETRNEQIAEEKNKYAKQLEDERANSLQNETRVIVENIVLPNTSKLLSQICDA